MNTAFLSGVRVLEIGSHYATRLSGMILAGQGASVTRLSGRTGSEKTWATVTDRDKAVVRTPAAAQELLRGADILLSDDSRGTPALSAMDDRLISCRIVSGMPDRGAEAPDWTEEEIGYYSGLYEPPAGLGLPRAFFLPLASTCAALHLANAAAASLFSRGRSGRGRHVEVSVADAALSVQVISVMMGSDLPLHWQPLKMLASPFMGVYRAADNGFVYVHLGMPRHLRSFLFLLEESGHAGEKEALRRLISHDMKRDPVMAESANRALRISRVLRGLFRKRGAQAWEDLLCGAGLCCTRVRTFAEWLSHPQCAADIASFAGPAGDPMKAPGSLVEFRPAGPCKINPEDGPLPLSGLRVLDLSRVIAGPYAARLLAEFGARVLRLALREKHLSWEEPFNAAFNAGKECRAIDVSRETGREAVRKLISDFRPHVVVQNFLEKAAVKLGVDEESFRRLNPGVVYVDIHGYRENGPWAGLPGFEQNVQAATGVLSAYSMGGTPRLLPVPFNDLSTGLIASFGAILACRAGRGGRVSAALTTPSALLQLKDLNPGNEPMAGKGIRRKMKHIVRAEAGKKDSIIIRDRGLATTASPVRFPGDGPLRFPPARMADEKPEPRGLLRRLMKIAWYLGQVKWLFVILLRERALRRPFPKETP